jgi:hypothetical protein
LRQQLALNPRSLYIGKSPPQESLRRVASSVNLGPMQRKFSGPRGSVSRGIIASWLCAALLSAFALSVVPRWHELIHSDANAPWHECAVTLIHSGNYLQPAPAPVVVAPAPVLQFSFVPALHSVWVASPFLGARIFEHAPPAFA